MAAATRKGDSSTGHDSCPPTPLLECSDDVLINGRGAGRVGDAYEPHGCIAHSSHADKIASGSATVFINGIPAGRKGDSVNMAGSVHDGSDDVFIGG